MQSHSKCSLIFSFLISFCLFLILLPSCTLQKQISRSANNLLTDSSLHAAHVGISIYEPSTGKYWYDHDGDKYFVPASNIKIPTCYAAMKYLGDSLVAFRYDVDNGVLTIEPNGDPVFLHPDFKQQPAYNFLKQYSRIAIWDQHFDEDYLGSGWSWNDYKEYYMAQRSAFPMYGNIVVFRKNGDDSITVVPAIFKKKTIFRLESTNGFDVAKDFSSNSFLVQKGNDKLAEVPFTPDDSTIAWLLQDTLHAAVTYESLVNQRPATPFYSQPVDSLLKLMMYRSDNFFAEQSLLMVANALTRVLSDEAVIDTLLKTDLKGLPQKPRWVDGSGLSRYNLFSPKDFVTILDKIRSEFGMDRVKTIFPTGGQGTLNNYYLAARDRIYAKTGTLSGVVSLSGYLYTKKNKLLIFSVLVNNHRASSVADLRRAVEKFLLSIRDRY
jgi:serine-type D-Ala-D-Ala carboxypeptidase/endopeptidase (penicillin-binding protein 4)